MPFKWGSIDGANRFWGPCGIGQIEILRKILEISTNEIKKIEALPLTVRRAYTVSRIQKLYRNSTCNGVWDREIVTILNSMPLGITPTILGRTIDADTYPEPHYISQQTGMRGHHEMKNFKGQHLRIFARVLLFETYFLKSRWAISLILTKPNPTSS